jgi:hypothetical protein
MRWPARISLALIDLSHLAFLHRISRGINHEVGLSSRTIESGDCQYCAYSECIIHYWGDCADLGMRGTLIHRAFEQRRGY